MTANMKGTMMSYLSIFLMDFGWCGMLGAESQVDRLVIGHTSDTKVRQDIHDWIHAQTSESRRCRSVQRSVGSVNARSVAADLVTTAVDSVATQERDWFPELRIRLQRFAQGVRTEFDDVNVQWPGQTAFQKRVVRATRRIEYGETVTYSQLATNAGAWTRDR